MKFNKFLLCIFLISISKLESNPLLGLASTPSLIAVNTYLKKVEFENYRDQKNQEKKISHDDFQAIDEEYSACNVDLETSILAQLVFFSSDSIQDENFALSVFTWPIVLGYSLYNQSKESKRQDRWKSMYLTKHIELHRDEFAIDIDNIVKRYQRR